MARGIPRRSFLQSSFAAALFTALPRHHRLRVRSPNILFILADDLGYGDLSCYGRPDYRTPYLDQLAREGLRFTSNYTAAAVCSPTRVALMTGRYPARLPIGLVEPLAYGDNSIGLPPEHPTPASLLKRAGYETALIGKWHLGYLPEHGPLRHGFEEFYGILSGGVDYFSHREPAGKLDLHEGNVTVDRAGYMTDLLTDRAVQYVRRRHAAPFYLALHYTAPHWPWEGPGDTAASRMYRTVADTVKDRFVKGYADGGSLRIFTAMMQQLDASVGRLLGALEDAGQSRDTFVVFTSDNGGERYSYNWPASDGKTSLREGGIRVPAIVRWPGRVPAGGTTDQSVITMDWTATMLGLAGAAADPGYPLDGVDLTPLCLGKSAQVDRALFWRTRAQDAARRGRWKYLRTEGDEMLFDIPNDPGERSNLDIYQPGALVSLREEFGQWNNQMLPRPS
ncbi:MAG: sulfatase-like hydrolase/transferase [Gemmatimonadales bacterium]|nr:sulfatase-like hydrolase/transferase [Gemmatimonadales bacterium]